MPKTFNCDKIGAKISVPARYIRIWREIFGEGVPTNMLTDEELLRYTGQTAVRDVQTALDLVDQTKAEIQAISLWIRRHWFSLPARLLRFCTTVVSTGADLADAIILGGLLALLPTILLISLLHPRLLVSLSVLLGSGALLYAYCYIALKTKPDEEGHDRNTVRRERLRVFFRELSALLAQREALVKELRRKRQLVVQLDKAVQKKDQIAALLSVDLRTLSGIQFEHFLQRVFQVRGYSEIRVTQASNDQGIDLIVGDGEARVAVQAKLYQGTVGNEAVQQAYAGMAHYRCDRCAVITNSTFTRSAIELARSTGCKLIDGQRLRLLIMGKEPL